MRTVKIVDCKEEMAVINTDKLVPLDEAMGAITAASDRKIFAESFNPVYARIIETRWSPVYQDYALNLGFGKTFVPEVVKDADGGYLLIFNKK